MRVLHEIEEEPDIKEIYCTGILNTAEATPRFADLYKEFPVDSAVDFNYDWRRACGPTTRSEDDGGRGFRRDFAELYPSHLLEVTKLDGAFEAALPVLMSGEADLIEPILPHVEGMLRAVDGLETALVHTMVRAIQVCWWLRKLGV